MINRVSTFIEEYGLQNKTVLVGFSGGFDSLTLLDIMNKIAPDYNIRLVAVHYNHNWRGEVAKEEQENCKKYCLSKGIEFYTETAPDNIKQNETEARELRYAFFERAMKKYNTDVVMTAHNFDDNAETVLYRIAKGTGIVGLKGILPKRENYYRPVLNITRAEIEQYCRDNKLSPNVDLSNNDTIHKRNLIRYDILPLLSEINPEIKTSLNSLAKIALSECEIVDEYIAKISQDILKDGKIDTKKFIKLSAPVQQKIIYNLIYESEFDYSRELILNICEFIGAAISQNKPSKFSLSDSAWLYVDSNIIEIISRKSSDKNSLEIDLENDGEYKLGKSVFKIEKCNVFYNTGSEEVVCVDLSDYKSLIIRSREDGDIIKPLGFDGTMKLKKYFMSKKIPQHRRDDYVLLATGNEVLWVAGIGLSDKIKTEDKTTHKLTIKYE